MSAERGTLASQLAPLAAALREKHGLVRQISQVLLECTTPRSDQLVRDARDVVLRWIENKAGTLPASAWDGEPFELADVAAQRAEAVRIDDYWAARVDDADSEVPRRTWITEITLAETGEGVLFGARLLNVTRGEDVSASRSIPRCVRDVAGMADFRIDQRPARTDPWIVDSPAEAQQLAHLIEDPSRRHSVCVFTLPEGSENPADTAVPLEPIANATVGAAHLAILTGPASYSLTDRLGKELSVFKQAIRTYGPGFHHETSDPAEHLIALPRRVENWPGGPSRFGDLLIEKLLRATVTGPDLENRFPPYSKVVQAYRTKQREDRAKRGASDEERLRLAREEKQELVQELEEREATFQSLLVSVERERDEEQGRLRATRARMHAYEARIKHLEAALAKTGVSERAAEIPDNFDSLQDWGMRHLAGTVVLHRRALRAAKKSPFEDVALVYKALLVLRDRYVPMRRDGGSQTRDDYEAALRTLHLAEAPCFTSTGAHREGDTYFIDFAGRKRELDRHLKGHSSRNPRYGFRLYFLWDEESEQVVVGSLPNHLDTRLS